MCDALDATNVLSVAMPSSVASASVRTAWRGLAAVGFHSSTRTVPHDKTDCRTFFSIRLVRNQLVLVSTWECLCVVIRSSRVYVGTIFALACDTTFLGYSRNIVKCRIAERSILLGCCHVGRFGSQGRGNDRRRKWSSLFHRECGCTVVLFPAGL